MFKANMIQLIQKAAFFLFLAESCVNQVGLSTPSMLKDWFCSKAFWYNLGSFPKLPGGRDGEMWVLEDYKPNRVNCFLLYFFNWGNSKIEIELS